MYKIELTPPTLEKFDLGGVLYHANYFHLFEQARERFLAEKAKLPYPTLVKQGQHLAIVETEVKYLKPVYYGDQLKITLSCSNLRNSSVVIHYKIYNLETSLLLNDSKTKLAFVSQKDGKFRPDKMPEQLIEALKQIEVN